MERRSFIRLAGLTTFGLMAGGNLVASALKMSNHQLIEIKPPNIHVRHGFFNLQVPNEKGLLIQRDIFNQNGLEAISEDRIASIKISDKNIAHYGIINKEGFNSKSKKLTAFKIKANSSKSIKIDSPCLIFSEYDDFLVDGESISKQQAIKKTQSGMVKLTSTKAQQLIIFNI